MTTTNADRGMVAMTEQELIFALAHHGAGCDGCGHEHNCGQTHCRLMSDAAEAMRGLCRDNGELKNWTATIAAGLGDGIIANGRMQGQLAALSAERDAAVTLIEMVNQLATGAIEYGPYQDGEEAKLFFQIETLTRTPAKQDEEG